MKDNKKLVVGVKDAGACEQLRQSFHDVPCVEVVVASPREFGSAGMDAEIMNCIIALERYGRKQPQMGRSVVLSTKGEQPTWVVTTPYGSPHGSWRRRADGRREWYDGRSLTEEDTAFELFEEAFAAISRFNAESEVELHTVGLHLALILGFGSFESLAAGLKRAWENWMLSDC